MAVAPVAGSYGDVQCSAGRTAIVIGAARGIGASIARELLAAEVSVVAVDTSPDVRTFDEAAGPHRSCGLCADITDARTISQAIEKARQLGESPTILVHSAFVEAASLLEDISPQDWARTLDVLLTSAWHSDVEFVRSLEGRGKASVNRPYRICSRPGYGFAVRSVRGSQSGSPEPDQVGSYRVGADRGTRQRDLSWIYQGGTQRLCLAGPRRH
jgi:NAD(P)-dependent dehydrogenase (short-subunit alcohol dehydrogenase family)